MQLNSGITLLNASSTKTPTLRSKSPDITWASTYAPKYLNHTLEFLSIDHKGDTDIDSVQTNSSCANFDK